MNVMKKLGQGLLVTIGVLGLAGVASAGPRTINSCKTIDEPGSYLVARNLTAAGDCLVVTASGVTIDLGGWMLTGNGTGIGVRDLYGTTNGTEVRNGTITGFTGGVELGGGNSIVDQVRARDNGTYGITVGAGSLVRNSVASNNGSIGIFLDCPSSAVSNTATGNPGANIHTNGPGCVGSQNVAP
jgi:hypothetical protein